MFHEYEILLRKRDLFYEFNKEKMYSEISGFWLVS